MVSLCDEMKSVLDFYSLIKLIGKILKQFKFYYFKIPLGFIKWSTIKISFYFIFNECKVNRTIEQQQQMTVHDRCIPPLKTRISCCLVKPFFFLFFFFCPFLIDSSCNLPVVPALSVHAVKSSQSEKQTIYAKNSLADNIATQHQATCEIK